MTSIERWRATWQGLGVAAPDELYVDVISRYQEPQRHYHTGQHLQECFAHLDASRALAEREYEVELALWFHDAVYAVRASDNEARSADLARAAALQAGLQADVAERVHGLIMVTRHDAVPAGGDAALLVDIDLAILGAPPDRFDEYEGQVRQEYSWVPGFLFRRKRREILEAFLGRPHLYGTGHFRLQLEERARANLARSVRRLGG